MTWGRRWRTPLTLAGAALALHACAGDPPAGDSPTSSAEQAESSPPSVVSAEKLPFVDSASRVQITAQLLPKPTALGETTALHVRLPPPRNGQLADTLVRLIGSPDRPQLLFRADALARLGVITKSPGKDFFTAFSTLSPDELARLKKDQEEIGSGVFGKPTEESIVVEGRSPVARTRFPPLDPANFRPDFHLPLGRCALRPIATRKGWDQSLFITDPAVVLNPTRTWDPCTGAGTQGGVWTFAHLVREMANGSGTTPEDFVLQWLSRWLNSYTVNGDVVPARTQMFNQVIRPWAVASGVTATLVVNSLTGRRSVTLSGPLNLNIAPFRLLAIVNRFDLGLSAGGAPLYGSTSGAPSNPGELRFVFGVVQPNPWGAGGSDATCGKKLFTTIFEYGVPGDGCMAAVSWAKKWTELEAMPGFTSAYVSQLESMTEGVVTHGAVPGKGNGNAINQIRTNEIALAAPWELREFHLADENLATDSDVPSNGVLRPHTVAQTPDDGIFPATIPTPTIDAFVAGPVTTGVALPVSNPDHCQASYTVPAAFAGVPFRGGNALIGPGHWEADSVTASSPARNVCARHQFSLNTCGGCHHDDTGTNSSFTSTNFTHVDPTSAIPVKLSSFLTGGGGPGSIFEVDDTQLGNVLRWKFADLDRRFQALFDVSHCTSCVTIFFPPPALVDVLRRRGPVPIDPDPRVEPPFPVGPITDLSVVKQLLDLRSQFAGEQRLEPATVFREFQAMSH